MKEFIKKHSTLFIIIILMFIMFVLIDNVIGKSILENSDYNSYELQARAWLKGKTYLDHDYEYLELAIYQGKYFVSFPPLPSLVLLPFAIIFPNSIPANLISFIIFTWEYILIYKILKRNKCSDTISLLLASGFTIGSNLLSLSVDSGVWFFAQLLNNFLCILAIDAFLKDKKALVYFFLALAVGCRPFSALYMVMFFVYYLVKEKDIKFFKRIIENIKPTMPAMIIAIIYMAYNYIRFDNPLEFGHNYLPVYTESVYGQFNIHYLLSNLKLLFFNTIDIDNKLNLSFGVPFSFIVANPIVIVYIYRSIKNIIKIRKIDKLRIMIFVTILLNIICICMHDTLGAWQFGARYTCDILPFIFLALLLYNGKKNRGVKLDKFEIACIIFGIMLNICGTILMHTDRLL